MKALRATAASFVPALLFTIAASLNLPWGVPFGFLAIYYSDWFIKREIKIANKWKTYNNPEPEKEEAKE